MAKVIRLFGKADSFDIEFFRKGRQWKVDVPPDMTDGVYAVQLTAIDENGETAYWVGELFMCSGICHLKIESSKMLCLLSTKSYSMKFSPKYRIVFSAEEYGYTFSENLGIRFKAEEKELYDVRFSASGGIAFSKSTNAEFKRKKIRVNSGGLKVRMQCATALSIRKECGHVW